jgi:hypothetical protein
VVFPANLATYRPMFALYLDIQKNILVEDLAEEAKGRWKSFIGNGKILLHFCDGRLIILSFHLLMAIDLERSCPWTRS